MTSFAVRGDEIYFSKMQLITQIRNLNFQFTGKEMFDVNRKFLAKVSQDDTQNDELAVISFQMVGASCIYAIILLQFLSLPD